MQVSFHTVTLSLLKVVLSQFAAANCFVVIMWCRCDRYC